MLKAGDIKDRIQIIINLGKDEKDILHTPSIGYKSVNYQDERGNLYGETFLLYDDMDILTAVEDVVRLAQKARSTLTSTQADSQ